MSDAVNDLAGVTPPAPPSGNTPLSDPPPTDPPAPSWLDGLDDDAKKFVEAKGYKSPADALTALRENAIPETPDAYELPVPDGQDKELANTARAWFHEAGIPPKQAAAFVQKWNEHAAAEQAKWAEEDAARARDIAAKAEREAADLKREWGETHDAQRELGKRAVNTYVPGATPEEKGKVIAILQREVGYAATMKMFAAIGRHLSEDTAHGMGSGPLAAAKATSIYDKSNMNP